MAKPPAKIAVLLACWAALASAQTTSFSLQLGYQSLTVDGNQEMYRSQVNEDEGFVLCGFSLQTSGTPDEGGLFDHLRVDAAGFGASPQARFRLEAGRARAYTLRASYSRAEHFSALPGLANPLSGSGIFPGQHTVDRASTSFDLDLELLPGRMLTPLVGYTRTSAKGPARTTYFVGQDEFRLASSLDETTDELRAGVAFHAGTFHATLLQGWRSFERSESLILAPGAGAGNSGKPVLGHEVKLDSLTRHATSEGDIPITTASFSGRLLDSRLRVAGSFVRSEFETDFTEEESLAGSLVSFKLSRFFSGLGETTRARAEAPDWRGELRLEAELVEGLELAAGYTRRHRERDGLAIVSSLYQGTTDFSGGDVKDLAKVLDAANAMERDEEAFEATVSSRNLGPVRLWAGFATVNEDLTVAEDAAEILVPGGQGGAFTREITRTTAGASLIVPTLRVSLDWRQDDADGTVVRTDYADLDRWRLRAEWKPVEQVRLIGTAETMSAENPAAGVNYEVDTRQHGLELEVSPSAAITARAGWNRFKHESNLVIRQPQDFSLVSSPFAEETDVLDAGLTLAFGRLHLEGSYSKLQNRGDWELKLNRGLVRCSIDLTKTLGAAVEYEANDFNDDVIPQGKYASQRLGFFLRWQS
ncbi:MAG: hypothetical protein V1750_10750 [Acidobacteriota bacterium]